MTRARLHRIAALGALAVCHGAPRAAASQTGQAGASFLLVPFDARNVGLGGAGVADPVGSSAVFVNPAAFARLTGRAASVGYAVDQGGNRLTATVTQASRVLGTFGASLYRYDLGSQELTDDNGVVTGLASFADYAYSASYAVAFTSRLTAGVSGKLVQYTFDCTGNCTDPLARSHPSTGAVDFGAQYDLGKTRGVHVGAAVRNLGLRLQVKDQEQADPLPTQVAVGVSWDVPNVEQYVPEATLRVAADAARGLGVELESMYHVGAEAQYRKLVTVRAGYAVRSGYGGPAVGFGVTRARLQLDVARQLTGSALFAEKPPTYVGLRYTF